MTDLKELAEAAKATADVFNALPASAYGGPEWHAHNDARMALREALGNDYDVILALYAERDGFSASLQQLSGYVEIAKERREAAEASLSAERAEVEKVRVALADYHAALRNREHGGVAAGRFVDAVTEALTKETPHAE